MQKLTSKMKPLSQDELKKTVGGGFLKNFSIIWWELTGRSCTLCFPEDREF